MSKSYRRSDHCNIWKNALDIEENAKHGKLPMLSEMAISVKSFVAQADGLGWQIAVNWCLCKWCQLYCPSCQHFNHWKEELAAHLSHLNRLNLKGGISKQKHLHRIWIEKYDFNDTSTVLKIIANKFYKEHINSIAQRKKVADEFARNINAIVNVVACDENNVMPYIQETFSIQGK